jgi:RHS repeat-associated protein
MKRTFAYSLSLFTILVVLSGFSAAQVATGTPAFNSFGGGPFDTVNLGNLNVHFAVPILHKAGRGLPFAYDLSYDSSVWTPVGSSGSQSWQPAANWGWQSPYGGAGYMSATPTVIFCQDSMGHNDGTTVYVSGFAYHDPWGITHPFNGQLVTYNPMCTGTNITSFTATATDGSGLILKVNTPQPGTTITTPAGLVISTAGSPPTGPVPTTSTDANGNQITQANVSGNAVFTDTLGQSVLTISGTTNPVTFQYTPPGGTAVQYKLNYTATNIKTNFGCSGVAEYTATNVLMVTSITLPDTTSYSFSYEPTQGSSGYYTGRISQVTLPTGGTITYTYPLSSDGTKNQINCADGSAPLPVGTSPSLTRTLSSPGGQWTYARTQVSGNHWQTKVSTPPDSQNSGSASDDTVFDFQEDASTGNYATYSFYETQRQAYQGSQSGGTLLLTTDTCWNGNSSCTTTTGVSSPITTGTATLKYPSSGLQSEAVTFYNGSGLVTETDQYGYGSGAPGSLLQKTVIGYASLGNNIVDHPSSITVTDVSGNVKSKTAYTYDEYSTYPLQVTSGTLQHTSVTGSRGNATTIASTVTGTTTLARHFGYFDTGNVYQAYDVNGAITTATYSNATATCSNAFPTGFTLPISGLSSSASVTLNCVGAVATASSDLNGNSSSASYTDLYYWRPASVTDPTTASTSFAYTPTTVDSRMLFNTSNSVSEQLTTVGGFGQVLYSQQREGPSSTNYDSTQVLYDSFLRAYQSTMPCVATAGQGCPSAAKTTSAFDALGRVLQTTDGGGGYVSRTPNQNDVKQAVGPAPAGENLKQRQMEYDALGRLTSVCELTSLTGYGNCAQTTNYNGYFTTYVYAVTTTNTTVTVTQNAQAGSGHQTRTYTYDLLGRLVSELNPENGTVNYTYDSDSAGTCTGTYNGDLVKLVDAKGNKICYQYDALHRVTQVSYPSGPDSANTPTKTFVYDAATFNSTAMSNAKGQLAEAYTGASGSKTTDEFFSYSVRGELTDTWECTPHSGSTGCALVGNYYHVTAGFWANGALNTLSSSITGVPTQTYGVDPMGRTYSVTAGSGQNPVTSTSYDLANYKRTVNYGSLDSDVNTFDPNTGRMTQYKFNVGSNSDTGSLTWNANGSLATLALADTVPTTTDTQTCSHTHDDLARIASTNCVNGATNKWNQNFTYDAFGNITKTTTGPGVSFLPGYSSSSNWITSLPGVTTTTDNNGQMTYDGTHNYTWDAAGKMHSVDTTTLTHDALGRMVETAVGSTYTQIVYSPLGKKFAIMNGQTLQKAFVPLPGAQAVYTSAGLAYYRHADHLGSSRLATTPTRTLYSSTAYAPYGEPYAQVGTTDLSFTGQDQDMVPGIHDFLLRKYAPVQGRWLSPDPAGLGAVDPSNPQSWNRYAYVLNNPLALVDPLGDYCYAPDGEIVECNGAPDGGPGNPYTLPPVIVSVPFLPPDTPPAPTPTPTPPPICSGGSSCGAAGASPANAGDQSGNQGGGNRGGGPTTPTPTTPKKQMVCNTLANISNGAADAADGAFTVGAAAGVITGVAALNVEAAPISEPVAAGAGIVAILSGGVGVTLKIFQYANTAFAHLAVGCK